VHSSCEATRLQRGAHSDSDALWFNRLAVLVHRPCCIGLYLRAQLRNDWT
jgi:hypothetical protein